MKAPEGKQYVTVSQTGETFLIDNHEVLRRKRMTAMAAVAQQRRKRAGHPEPTRRKAPEGKQYVTVSQTGETFLIDSPEVLRRKRMTATAAVAQQRRKRADYSSRPGK